MNLQLCKNLATRMELRDATDQEKQKDTFELKFSPSFHPEKKNEFAIAFQLELTFEEKFLAADYLSIFETSEDFESEFESSPFVKANAPAIAFPFLRSYIAHITLIAGYNPVVLPSVNFVNLSKKGLPLDKPEEPL